MKTLVVVFNYPRAAEFVQRHWPWYERSGCDIVGIGTYGGGCWWPQCQFAGNGAPTSTGWFHGYVDIGEDSYVKGDHLPKKMVRTLEWLVNNSRLAEYDHFCLTEPDAIFLRPIPNQRLAGLYATVACGPQSGFLGTRAVHGPWWVDRETACNMVKYGERMIAAGLIERGFPDYFIGLMVDLYGIPFYQDRTFSVNLIDRPEFLEAARKAIEQGFFYVHGVKTEEQLRAITEGLIS